MILYLFIPLFLLTFSNLYSIFKDYFECKPYLETYEEICQLEKESSGNHHIKKFDTLDVKNVSINLENKKNISIPDLNIKKGEKILIIGESGLGKTTLFNILLGFTKNYEGEIFINHTNLKNIDIKSLRNLIGISFQKSELFSLSLKDNILLGSNIDLDSLINLFRLSKVKDENDNLLNENKLSGGEKARINLAQNLARNPEVILIDETFSSLDEENEKLILQNILKKYKDKTIICISHKLSLRKYFDRHINYDKLIRRMNNEKI